MRKELTSYYNRQYFEDADRSSGWYRVDDFLKWVYKNEKALSNATVLLGNEPNYALSYPEKSLVFYRKLIVPFSKSGFSCEKVLPEAVKLLDQMAGKDNISVVPDGYI